MVDEREFQEQQEAIRKWADKNYRKLIGGWWFKRRMKRIEKLASIFYGRPISVEIVLRDKKEKQQ